MAALANYARDGVALQGYLMELLSLITLGRNADGTFTDPSHGKTSAQLGTA